MKTVKWFCVIILFLCPFIINSQTYISGFITQDLTLRKEKSPYILKDNLQVNPGVKLTIEKGTIINLNRNSLIVYRSQIVSDSIIFQNGIINFENQSGGSITNSKLNAVFLDLDISSPLVISNNIFDQASEIIIYNLSALKYVDLGCNTFNNNKVRFSMTSSENLDIVNIKNIGSAYYYLENTLEIKNTSLKIESGAKFDLNNNYFNFSRKGSSPASFEADNASFHNGTFWLSDSTSGFIKNCNFAHTQVTIKGYSSVGFSNSVFDTASSLTIYSDKALSNLSDDNTFANGCVYIKPTGLNDIELKGLRGANYSLISYVRMKGKKLSLLKNTRIDLAGYSLRIEGTEKNMVLFNVDSVSFFNGLLMFTKSTQAILKGCSFTGTTVTVSDSAAITISNSLFFGSSLQTKDNVSASIYNNSFDSASRFDCNATNGIENVFNNDFKSNTINIGFPVTREITLKNLGGITYKLNSDLEVSNKAKLNIESGVILNGEDQTLICYKGGSISASNTIFNIGEISFTDFENANIENSTFKKCRLSLSGNYNPRFKNNSITGSSLIWVNSQNIFDSYEVFSAGNVYTRRTLGINGMVDVNKKISIDTLAVSYGISGTKRKIQGNYVIWGGIDLGYFPGYSGELEITGCKIINSMNINLHTDSKAKFTDCVFEFARIAVYENSSVEISNTDFLSPSIILVYSTSDINLVNNYWGNTSGPKYSQTLDGQSFHIYCSRLNNKIKYTPFATTSFHNLVKTEKQEDAIPNEFYLYPNYPNPFNPSTKIKFTIPEAELVNLKIFNILSQEVACLVNEMKSAGTHVVNFNALNLPTGTYIARLQAGSKVISMKLLLVK